MTRFMVDVLARTRGLAGVRQSSQLNGLMGRRQGADILFIDALRSREEMRAFCKIAPHVPKMANMLEGGSTPILSPEELEEMGFKICAYPLSLLVSTHPSPPVLHPARRLANALLQVPCAAPRATE